MILLEEGKIHVYAAEITQMFHTERRLTLTTENRDLTSQSQKDQNYHEL